MPRWRRNYETLDDCSCSFVTHLAGSCPAGAFQCYGGYLRARALECQRYGVPEEVVGGVFWWRTC